MLSIPLSSVHTLGKTENDVMLKTDAEINGLTYRGIPEVLLLDVKGSNSADPGTSRICSVERNIDGT